MPTYYGYQSRQGEDRVDYVDAFETFGTKVQDAITTRDREREAFSEQEYQASAAVENIEINSDQSFQDGVLKWADSAREQIYDWSKKAKNGEITQSEYKRRLNAISDTWTSTANFAKTFDERNQRALTRQQPNEDGVIEGSSLEADINQRMSAYGYVGDAEMVWGENGVGALVKRDENGDIYETINANRLNQPGNMMDIPRFSITTETKSFTDTWKEWMTYESGLRGASTTITDVRKNPEYIRGRETAVRSMLSSDNKVVGVLTDNGAMSPQYYEDANGDGEPDGVSYVGSIGYDFYGNESEKIEKVDQKVSELKKEADFLGRTFNEKEVRSEVESMMIQQQIDPRTGIITPILTPEQRHAAESNARTTIEMQLGHKVVGKERWKPSSSGGGGGGKKNNIPSSVDDLYNQARKAFDLSKDDPDRSAAILSNLTGDDYFFKWEEGGLQAYKTKAVMDDETGKIENKGIPMPGKIENTLDLHSYFMGETDAKGQAPAFSEWKRAREKWNADHRIGTKKGGTDPLGIN